MSDPFYTYPLHTYLDKYMYVYNNMYIPLMLMYTYTYVCVSWSSGTTRKLLIKCLILLKPSFETPPVTQ
jgi:hypothetical protein